MDGKIFGVGILGAENSHAAAFSRIFNEEKKYSHIRVTAVGGNYPEANRKVFDSYGLQLLAEKPEDMLGQIDAVMVTARDGKFHAPFALPFIDAGIPAFIDKPFTRDTKEAEEIVSLARAKNVPIVGGSSVKSCYDVRMLKYYKEKAEKDDALHGGIMRAPLSMENEYGGFWFYASHLVEMCLTVFGYSPVSVTAHRRQNDVIAIIDYERYSVTCCFVDGCYSYSGTVLRKGSDDSRVIDIGMCYDHECEEFSDMLLSGRMSYGYDELIMPVYVISAIISSYETGKTVEIGRPASGKEAK